MKNKIAGFIRNLIILTYLFSVPLTNEILNNNPIQISPSFVVKVEEARKGIFVENKGKLHLVNNEVGLLFYKTHALQYDVELLCGSGKVPLLIDDEYRLRSGTWFLRLAGATLIAQLL